MGISAGGSKGGPKSDMNVTPLVDVMLVLLVIFMVTMPVMMRSITIEIPRELDDVEVSVITPVIVTGMVDGTLEISEGPNTEIIQRTQLAKVLRGRLKDITSEKTVFVDFEDGVPWEQVVSVMDTVKGVGKVDAKNVREVIKVALKKRDKPPGAASAPE